MSCHKTPIFLRPIRPQVFHLVFVPSPTLFFSHSFPVTLFQSLLPSILPNSHSFACCRPFTHQPFSIAFSFLFKNSPPHHAAILPIGNKPNKMRFPILISSLFALALPISVFAQTEKTTNAANPISAPVAGSVLTSGTAFTIKWTPTAGKFVQLTLRKGPDKSLAVLEVIAEQLPNNASAFIWYPSTELQGGTDYAIEITSDDPPTSNYSAQFKIVSNGPGIKGKPIEPSTTRSVYVPLQTDIPTYTGSQSAPMPTYSSTTTTTSNSGKYGGANATNISSSANGLSVGIFAQCLATTFVAFGAVLVFL